VEKLQHSLATVNELKNQAVKHLSSRTVLADELQKKVDSLTLSLQSCVDAKNGASKECKTSISALSQELDTVKAAHKSASADLQAAKASLRDASLKLVLGRHFDEQPIDAGHFGLLLSSPPG
jgi:seryl-tRNA synthetase